MWCTLRRRSIPNRFRTRLITGRITEDEGDMTYYARERGVEVTEIAGMSRLLSPLRDLLSFVTLLRIFRPRAAHHRTHAHCQGGGRLDGWRRWPPGSR